ncbi:hypothetical protein P4B35_05505 [Pontiellaceae bacterium B12227]|nr:hypothetical protein [Pontiellaceae bacterium B12227]
MRKTIMMTALVAAAAGAVCAETTTNLVVGWDTFKWQNSGTDPLISEPTVVDGATGEATQDGNWRISDASGSHDETYGSFSGYMAATNDRGYNIVLSNATAYVDFEVESTGDELDLVAFHFDSVGRSNIAHNAWQLEILAGGSLTAGVVESGSLSSSTNAGRDLFDYDVDLTGLTDHGLSAATTFRLTFSGGSTINTNYLTDLDNVGLTAEVPIPPPVPDFELLAGWEQWSSTHAGDASRADGVDAVYTDVGAGINTLGANTNGTFGTLATVPPADQTNENNNDGARIANGADGTFQFSVTNTSGIAKNLGAFHMDVGVFRPNAANEWTLTVLSGSAITTGQVTSGIAPNVAGGVVDWTEYDVPLYTLADNELENGGVVIFELAFTGGASGSAGHHLFLDNVAVSKAVNVPEQSDFLIGWEVWSTSGPVDASTKTNDIEGAATTMGWSIDTSAANTNGIWGGSLTNPVADVTANAVNDGARLTNGGEGYWDFAITNTSAEARTLGAFHFNSASLRPSSSRDWMLEVLAGSSITPGLVDVGTIPVPASGGTADWYGKDIYLTDLADYTLEPGGTVTFRLNFTGGVSGTAGHHQFLDNVAVSTFVDTTEPINLNSAIVAYLFDPSGTSSLSFTGAVSTAYIIKSTGDLANTGFTPVVLAAATVGTLTNGTIVTTDTGAATAEFSESANAQFYKVESAP